MCRSCCYQPDSHTSHECEGNCTCSGKHVTYYVKASGQTRKVITVDLTLRKEL